MDDTHTHTRTHRLTFLYAFSTLLLPTHPHPDKGGRECRSMCFTHPHVTLSGHQHVWQEDIKSLCVPSVTTPKGILRQGSIPVRLLRAGGALSADDFPRARYAVVHAHTIAGALFGPSEGCSACIAARGRGGNTMTSLRTLANHRQWRCCWRSATANNTDWRNGSAQQWRAADVN